MSSVVSAVGNGAGMWRGPAGTATVRGMGAGVVVGELLAPRRVRRHVVTPPRAQHRESKWERLDAGVQRGLSQMS